MSGFFKYLGSMLFRNVPNVQTKRCVNDFLMVIHGYCLPDRYKTQRMCEKTVYDYPQALEFVPDRYKIKEMC